MSDKGSSPGTVLAAFVVGALAGAAVALLFAPASGEETRRKLAQKARDAKRRADELAQDGREFIERHGETVAAAINRGREAFDASRKETL